MIYCANASSFHIGDRRFLHRLTRRIDRSATDEPHAGKPHSRRATEKITRPSTHRGETSPRIGFFPAIRIQTSFSGGFQRILFRCPLFALPEVSWHWDFELSYRFAMILLLSQDLLNLNIYIFFVFFSFCAFDRYNNIIQIFFVSFRSLRLHFFTLELPKWSKWSIYNFC